MKILSKNEAKKAIISRSFCDLTCNSILRKERLDMGKYAESGIGKEATTHDDIVLIWSERRSDENGAYYALFCLSKN